MDPELYEATAGGWARSLPEWKHDKRRETMHVKAGQICVSVCSIHSRTSLLLALGTLPVPYVRDATPRRSNRSRREGHDGVTRDKPYHRCHTVTGSSSACMPAPQAATSHRPALPPPGHRMPGSPMKLSPSSAARQQLSPLCTATSPLRGHMAYLPAPSHPLPFSRVRPPARAPFQPYSAFSLLYNSDLR